MEDHKWLRLAQQKASEYQAAAKRYSLAKPHRAQEAERRNLRCRKHLAQALFSLAKTLSPDITTSAETESRVEMTRAVIFDLFGTLVPTYAAQETDRKTAEALGVSEERYYEALASSAEQRYRGRFSTVKAMFEHIFALLDLSVSERTLEQVITYRLEATKLNLRPRADAVQTLKRLKKEGFKLGVLSDSSPDVPALYAETCITKLVNVSVFSCLVKLKKPDPNIYKLVCEELGVLPGQCVYVGDGGSCELSGAQSVGMRPVLLRVPKGEPAQLEAKEWKGEAVNALEELVEAVSRSCL